MLDLSKIAGKRVAVHISTAEKAEVFIAELKQRFPDRVDDDPIPLSMIARYEGSTYSGFCYYPRFGESRKMTYGDRATYDDWGVPVVEFEDLIVAELVTNKSDIAIEFLFK